MNKTLKHFYPPQKNPSPIERTKISQEAGLPPKRLPRLDGCHVMRLSFRKTTKDGGIVQRSTYSNTDEVANRRK